MKKNISQIFIFIFLITMMIGLMSFNKDSSSELSLESKAIVLNVDNSEVVDGSFSRLGFQELNIRILNGKFKEQEVKASNNLLGSMDFDSFYKKNDTILVSILEDGENIVNVKTLEHYRQNWILALFIVFALCIIGFAKIIGLKSLFSFIATLYILWTFLIPNLLLGKNPLIFSSLTIVILTGVIIFSIAGVTRKGISAFLGTICGLFLSLGLTLFFGSKINLTGLTEPFAETLLFSGYIHLNMKDIFYSAIIIGASGAAMDIAMDISSSMDEVLDKKPNLSRKELIHSGFNVGKDVIGTMSTTLLLAYSGGYLTLLMLFMSKNSSLSTMLNLKIVSSEIMRTLVGSIGLVFVAPLTAIFAGYIYTINIKNAEILDKETEKLSSN
ncbi:YibE/F family protein [Gottschalkia acidurici]|nr:YibE/F family protein [Gottschalkia acidurici]